MKSDQYSEKETKRRFDAIMRGAMHKPTQLADIPRKRKRKAPKPSPSGSSRANG
jgi:hypothetical protein